MSLRNEIIALLLSFLLCFFYIRCFLNGLKTYQLNNSAYKKRKKGETFGEWLIYSRYKEEIPKSLKVLYFIVLFSHPAAVMICVLLHLIRLSGDVDKILTHTIMIFDAIWVVALELLFWTPGLGYAYDRWIRKKRGMKRKRRK